MPDTTAPGRLMLTGLLNTGKTMVAEVLMSLGWDFGPRNVLHAVSLEHPAVVRIARRICEVFETSRADAEGRQAYNSAYARYDTGLHQQALHANDLDNIPPRRRPEMQHLPEAFKVPYPAAMPVLCDMYRPQVIVWCYREKWDEWEQAVRDTDFFYQRTPEPKPPLRDIYYHSAFLADMLQQKMGYPIVFFCLEDRTFRGSEQAFQRLELTQQDCQQRLKALLVETGGELGMGGRWAPSDPVHFPPKRRAPEAMV